MKKILFSIILVLFCAGSVSGYTYEDEAWDNLQNLAWQYEQEAWDTYGMRLEYRDDLTDMVVLKEGGTITMSGTLYAGNIYIIAACGDSRAADLDIYIYDEYWNTLESDTSTGRESSILFSVDSTQTYNIKVKLYDSFDYSAIIGFFVGNLY